VPSHERLHVDRPGRSRFERSGPPARRQPPILYETVPPVGTRHRDRTFRRLLLAADMTAALLVVAIAGRVLADGGLWASALVLPFLVPLVNTAAGLYRRDELVLASSTLDEAPAVFQAATLCAVLNFLVSSLTLSSPLGGRYVAVTMVGLTVLTLLLRGVARTGARRLTPPERCLVVGQLDTELRLGGRLRTSPAVKAELVGSFPLGGSAEAWGLDGLAGLPQAVRDTRAERVIIAGDGAPAEHVHATIEIAKSLGAKVSLLPGTFDVVGSAVAFDYLGGLTLLGVRRFGLSRRAQAVKRTLDWATSAGILLALAPLLATIAVAVRISSPGPALFRQTRVGRDGRRFEILKFRSMVLDAEARKDALRDLNEAEGLFKIRTDPRITRLGRVLRRSHLDELPQLVNVLRGEMSLVGPRPLVIDEDLQIHGWHRRRLELTPGVTGAWQVLGAARVPMVEMVAIDYLYVTNWSLWGDIKVLLRTVPCVLGRRGE
jgi:exopolysaccharide biosynthesis polyprenyl glycosylphosphotransferase